MSVPGLLPAADHVPVPDAAIVTEPPGSTTQLSICSGPALGCADTVTLVLSAHEPLLNMKTYVPTVLKFVIVVVGEVGFVIVAVPILLIEAVQVPVPVPAIVALLLLG